MVSAAVNANSHVTLEFDSTESIATGTPRKMGFQLVKSTQRYAYQGYDDEPTQLVNEVQSNGFTIFSRSLEILFKKDNWSGPFGAYLERPGQNRPAFTIGVDHRVQRPTLGPRQYTAGVGVGQAAFPARISGFVEFKNESYVCIAGRIVYKLTWAAGSAYFTAVFTHSNANAVLRDLRVCDGYMYVAAGSTAAYAYTADGAAWTESNRGNPDDKAEQFLVLNNYLHKFITPNMHYQTTSGINGGSDWQGADYIGESSSSIQMMNGLTNNIVFPKDAGIYNLDQAGNIKDVYPELQTLQDIGNGWHSFVWHNKLLYPTLYGELFILADGVVTSIAPAFQMERAMEVSPASLDVFSGRVRAITGTQDYLFAEIQRASDSYHRIMVLQEIGGVYVWRTFVDLGTTTSDELWVTSASTSGPVLWATTASDLSYKAAYWILPAGPDPLQDARLNYSANGFLYEPWLDMGCGTTAKRWDTIQLDTYSADRAKDNRSYL